MHGLVFVRLIEKSWWMKEEKAAVSKQNGEYRKISQETFSVSPCRRLLPSGDKISIAICENNAADSVLVQNILDDYELDSMIDLRVRTFTEHREACRSCQTVHGT